MNAAGLRVLVVEDDTDCAESAAMVLRCSGHSVEVVTDGHAALKAAECYSPDVVLVDLGLPRMNGWEVSRRIKDQANGRKPVVIAVTGWTRDEDRQRSAEAGIDLHLLKPVDPVELEAALKGLHEQKGVSSPSKGRGA